MFEKSRSRVHGRILLTATPSQEGLTDEDWESDFMPFPPTSKEPMVSTAVVVSLGKGLQWQHGMAYLQRANVGTVDAYTMSASILSCGCWVKITFK